MNDLISRQDAIDAINHICPIDTEYDCTLLDRMDVRYVLSELPSAEPIKLHVDHDLTEEEIKNLKQKIADSPIVFMPSVERKGKWVVDEEYIDCSVCRKQKWSRVPFENLVKGFNYCPNCGADMRGEPDEKNR